MMATRLDVAGLTLKDRAKARTQDWHPVLDTYANGVRLMRGLPETDPRSWLWAANTHGIPAGTRPRPAWSQCAHGSVFFLPWHRAYLAWFEKTIRDLTDDDDWRLPYWDYSAPADVADRTLPAEFTVETRTVEGRVVPNPLFDARRNRGPIVRDDVDIVAALSETRYVRLFPQVGFGGTDRRVHGDVERLPHDFVHGDIGGLMRATTTAGRDPIFWLHHSNIDRLWEVWRQLPGSVALTDSGAATALLVSQWQSAIFFFGRERSPSTFTMDEVENLDTLEYDYESTTLPPNLAAAVDAARARAGRAGGGIALDETEPSWEPVAATFDLDSGEDRDVTLRSGPRGLDEAPPAGLILELAGVQATDPHQVYVVEVRSEPGAEPHRAGRFSTFGLEGTPDTEERNYVVDASAVLGDLAEEGWSGGQLSVTVVPEEGRPDSDDPEKGIHIRQVTVYVQNP
jgi:hypothetical protein